MCILDTATVRVPRVYAYGAFPEAHEGVSRGSFIIMEALEMEGVPDQAALGKAIAQMHLAEPKVCGTRGDRNSHALIGVDNTHTKNEDGE